MIWNLGLPKTGTLSLNKALWRLGFRVAHSDPSINTRLVTEPPEDSKALERIFAGFDGGNEMPQVRKNYGLIEQLDPKPKFIFTHRDCYMWKKSMERHRANNSERRLWPIFQHPEKWDDLYYSHTDKVLDYFHGREDFLFMDIFDGDGFELLAPFLDKTAQPEWEFPHVNKSVEAA